MASALESNTVNPALLHQPSLVLPDASCLPEQPRKVLLRFQGNISEVSALTLLLYLLQDRLDDKERLNLSFTSEAHSWLNGAIPEDPSHRPAVLEAIEQKLKAALRQPDGMNTAATSQNWTSRGAVTTSRTGSLSGHEDSDIDDRLAQKAFHVVGELIKGFLEATERCFLALPALNRTQRRHFHAVAHFLFLGHLSVGSGPDRHMLISKRRDDLSWEVKSRFKDALRQATLPNDRATVSNRIHLEWPAPLDDEEILPSPDEIDNYYSGVSSGVNSGHFSASSGFSRASGSSYSRRKRRRRELNAFVCTYPGCDAVFDRQCDLAHHERVHMPYYLRPHGCDLCEKRFLHPKDLRRHMKTHPFFAAEAKEGGFEEDVPASSEEEE